jgi:cobalt-zinc-cadmium efflux system membrane fusion protein
MRKRYLYNCIFVLSGLLGAGCGHVDQEHVKHATHDSETEAVHDGHGGESPGDHGEESEITISPEGMKMAGITMAKAAKGRIKATLELSGEVGFDEDRYVHVTPRFPGVARESKYRVGEQVSEGAVVAVIESNESMTAYSLKSPITGRIIKKHITAGEYLSGQESIYEIADLSNVWVNLAVYPKDASKIKPGQKVVISAINPDISSRGSISYVTPVMDAQTRRITARVVIPNADNSWRPGTFVNAQVETGESEEGIVVEKNAVQVLYNKTVVFIQHEPGSFKPVEVATGECDCRAVLIRSGLDIGAEYVCAGAFEIKAKIVTSSLGSHAGHGH